MKQSKTNGLRQVLENNLYGCKLHGVSPLPPTRHSSVKVDNSGK
uniref:Uncharacterized protein n=1 Tax=Anguilla anguilla TaxID=7936 RepID=A0A0E9U0P3_ANGAN